MLVVIGGTGVSGGLVVVFLGLLRAIPRGELPGHDSGAAVCITNKKRGRALGRIPFALGRDKVVNRLCDDGRVRRRHFLVSQAAIAAVEIPGSSTVICS